MRIDAKSMENTRPTLLNLWEFWASVAQQVLRLEPGAQVICAGVLRRRFWKTAGGLGSALEGEVRSLKRAPENR